MTSPKPGFDEKDVSLAGHDCAVGNEHKLVTALRDILENPKRRTVGDLSEVVLSSLAELSLLRDRLDLVAASTESAECSLPAKSISDISSGPCQSGEAGTLDGKR